MQQRVLSERKARRVRRRWSVAALVVVMAGAYLYYIWLAPFLVMRRFVRAVEQRDGQEIVTLSCPLDREKAGLTADAAAIALARIFPTLVRQQGAAIPDAGQKGSWRGASQRTTPVEGTMCVWNVGWADARTGQLLPTPEPGLGNQLSSQINLKPTASGWRVLFGEFLRTTAVSRWGWGPNSMARASFIRICREAGLRGYVDTTDEFVPLETLEVDQ
jgi:hypothetical protein